MEVAEQKPDAFELYRLKIIEQKAVDVVNAAASRNEKTKEDFWFDLGKAIRSLHAVCESPIAAYEQGFNAS